MVAGGAGAAADAVRRANAESPRTCGRRSRSWPDVHQARPTAVHEVGPASAHIRRRTREAAGCRTPGAGRRDPRGGAQRARRGARGDLRLVRRPAAGVGVDRPGAWRRPCGRDARGGEGPRPGAVSQVQVDLEILQNLATRATRAWEFARDFDAVGLVDEFAETIRAELDYLEEGRNAERFARDFQEDASVVIPRVYWEHTTSRVLTLERMSGMNVVDAAASTKPGGRARPRRPTGARTSC